MNKYQMVFTDGTVDSLAADFVSVKEWALVFYRDGELVKGFAANTVKSFMQLPPGAA